MSRQRDCRRAIALGMRRQGLTLQKIANYFGISPKGVNKLVRRGLRDARIDKDLPPLSELELRAELKKLRNYSAVGAKRGNRHRAAGQRWLRRPWEIGSGG